MDKEPKVLPMKPRELPSVEERSLTITALQDAMLRAAQAAVLAAQEKFNAVAGAVIAGHDINEARIVRIEPGNILVVELSPNGKQEG